MEVDALKKGNGGSDSHALFMKFMRGKCFGCGATDHTKKQWLKDGEESMGMCE